MSLSDLFDGQLHMMQPGEHFNDARHVVLTMEEAEEEEPLDPYETPSQVAMIAETGQVGRILPDQQYSQGWGALSLCLGAAARLLGGTKDQYQHNHYDAKSKYESSEFSFLFKPGVEDETWDRL